MLYNLLETELGWVAVAGRDGKIARLMLPEPNRAEALSSLKEGISDALVETDDDFSGEADRLRAYFAGKTVTFECEIDAPGASPFDIEVWKTAREIGYGETRTYGWIADRIGRPGAARAVGGAMGRNPVPVVVPCHRVVRAGGGLGGFSAGIEWKIKLLGMERVGE